MSNNAQGTNPLDSWQTPDDAFKTTFISCNLECPNDETGIYGLAVWLYEDEAFTNWVNALDNPTEDEKTYRDSMSSYTLAIECDI